MEILNVWTIRADAIKKVLYNDDALADIFQQYFTENENAKTPLVRISSVFGQFEAIAQDVDEDKIKGLKNEAKLSAAVADVTRLFTTPVGPADLDNFLRHARDAFSNFEKELKA